MEFGLKMGGGAGAIIAKGTQRPHQHRLLGGLRPNGRTLATGSYDHTARLWDTDVDRVAARICSITTPITRSEWNQYLPGLAYHPPCP